MKDKLKLRNAIALTICLAATIMFSACSKEDKTVRVNGVTLSETTATLTVGDTLTLRATVTPEVATNKALTWTSVPEAVATVNSNGLVTAVAQGTAIIKVTTQDGNKTASCYLTIKAATVPAVPVTGVTLSETTADLTTGGTLALTATVLPANATNTAVTWASNNTTVATVTDGTVTGIAAGMAVITVFTQDGNKMAACTVTVANPILQMTMTTSNASVMFGLIGSGTVTIDWGDGTNSTTETLANSLYCNHNYSGSSAHTITITGENITYLDCPNNQLTSLDVSKNTALEWLYCYNNQLTSLDVSKNTVLEYLGCSDNQLTALDVSKNTALTDLVCNDNQLTTLDMSNNTALIDLECQDNQLTADALEALFRTLHGNPVGYGKDIYIGGNSGAATCDRSIAENKGWTVRN